MRKLKIHKTISKRNLNNQEGKDSEGCLPELRPQIDFHDFLRQLSHDIRKFKQLAEHPQHRDVPAIFKLEVLETEELEEKSVHIIRNTR